MNPNDVPYWAIAAVFALLASTGSLRAVGEYRRACNDSRHGAWPIFALSVASVAMLFVAAACMTYVSITKS